MRYNTDSHQQENNGKAGGKALSHGILSLFYMARMRTNNGISAAIFFWNWG